MERRSIHDASDQEEYRLHHDVTGWGFSRVQALSLIRSLCDSTQCMATCKYTLRGHISCNPVRVSVVIVVRCCFDARFHSHVSMGAPHLSPDAYHPFMDAAWLHATYSFRVLASSDQTLRPTRAFSRSTVQFYLPTDSGGKKITSWSCLWIRFRLYNPSVLLPVDRTSSTSFTYCCKESAFYLFSIPGHSLIRT